MAKKNKVQYNYDEKGKIILTLKPRNMKEDELVNVGDYIHSEGILFGVNKNVGRDIPNIYDGLTSIERRLLYTMYMEKGYPDKPREKVSSYLGALLKDYHPHTDRSAYKTITRFGRNFSTMLLYVDKQGNFGDAYTKKPGSDRYIEARLSKYAFDCYFSESDVSVPIYDTVDNYKYTLKEPKYLASKYPNVLMQWNSGIGAGIASTLCAFNSKDIFNTAIKILDDPNCPVEIYPDFPMNVTITNKSELKKCFDMHKFSIKVEGKWRHEILKSRENGKLVDKYYIVFTSYPINSAPVSINDYLVKINEGEKKAFKEIKDIRCTAVGEEGDGLEFYIEYEKGYDPTVLAEKIIKSTAFGSTIGANYVLIKDNKPHKYTPRKVLLEWINIRMDQKRRYIHQKLLKIGKEKVVNEAFIYLIENNLIEEAIKIIRAAKDDNSCIEALRAKCKLSYLQAKYIIEVKLKRLNKLGISETRDKYKKLVKLYEYYVSVCNEEGVKELIKQDLLEGKELYSKPRKATLINKGKNILVDEAKIIVYNSNSYYCIKDISELENITDKIDKSYDIISIKNSDNILIFGEDGYTRTVDGYSFNYSKSPIDINKVFRNQRGTTICKIMRLKDKVTGVALFTKNGYGKILSVKELSLNINKVITLSANDSLISAVPIRNNHGLIGLTVDDELYYVNLDTLPNLKKSAMGNKVIKSLGGSIINNSMYIDTDKYDNILLYGESGYVKIIPVSYLISNKKSDDFITMKGKKLFGVIGINDNDKLRVYFNNNHIDMKFKIDNESKFRVTVDTKDIVFKPSSTIGESTKVFKLYKNDFYKISYK